MKISHKRLLMTALLAGAGLVANAQTPPPAPGASGAPGRPMMDRDGGRHMDPARMHEFMQKRVQRHLDELKVRLQLTPAQEGAWQQFAAAMQPPAQMPQRPDRAAFERMTTPERIDQLRTMRNARNAEMDRKGDAAKTFYGQLNASQKRVFDLESLRMLQQHRGHRGMGGWGHHGGDGRDGRDRADAEKR